MMMDSEMMTHMMGGNLGGAIFLGWLSYLLVIVLIIMTIIALVKYLSK